MSNPIIAAYAATEVDPIIDELTDKLGSAMEVAKQANARAATAEAEVVRLKGEISKQSKVVLEKVASKDEKGISPDLIGGLVSNMVTAGLLSTEKAAAYTQNLAASPNNVVKLASRLLQLSHPAPSGGQGVEKSASLLGHEPAASEDDGWDLVRSEGA